MSSIQEEYVSDGGVVGPIEEHVNVGDVLEEQVLDGDVGEMSFIITRKSRSNFAAANPPDKSKLDSSPEEDDDCVFIDGAPKCPVAPNRSLSIYSLSDAWTRKNLQKSHSKFSGTSTSWHMFLQPELHCKQCSFPQSSTIIFIGDQAYINKCTNTNVWLNGDFVEGFAMLLYHYSHSSGMLTATDKFLPQLVHVAHPKQTH